MRARAVAGDVERERDLQLEPRLRGGSGVLRDVLRAVSVVWALGEDMGWRRRRRRGRYQGALFLVDIHLVGVLVLHDWRGTSVFIERLEPRCGDEGGDAGVPALGTGSCDFGGVGGGVLVVGLRLEGGGVEEAAERAGIRASAGVRGGVEALLDQEGVKAAGADRGEGSGGAGVVGEFEMGKHLERGVGVGRAVCVRVDDDRHRGGPNFGYL